MYIYITFPFVSSRKGVLAVFDTSYVPILSMSYVHALCIDLSLCYVRVLVCVRCSLWPQTYLYIYIYIYMHMHEHKDPLETPMDRAMTPRTPKNPPQIHLGCPQDPPLDLQETPQRPQTSQA